MGPITAPAIQALLEDFSSSEVEGTRVGDAALVSLFLAEVIVAVVERGVEEPKYS